MAAWSWLFPERRAAHEDVAELRERTQRLGTRNRRTRDVEAGWQPEERVRHLVVQRRAEGQKARIELIDVQGDIVGAAAQAEIDAGRARVFEADGNAPPDSRLRSTEY